MPTVIELQSLFLKATSANVIDLIDNSEMCRIHDWPLYGQCGGINSPFGIYYWSSNPDGKGNHYGISLNNGEADSQYDDVNLHQVACVR